MRQNIVIAFAISFIFLLSGCGSDSDSFVQTSTAVPQVVSLSLTSQTGGTVLHPSGHSATFAPTSLEQDTIVTLSLLDASTIALRNIEEFQPVGQALKIDLSGASVVGQAQFEIPYQTTAPQNHGVYWHLPEGLSIPLVSTYNASTSSFTATVDFTDDALLQSAAVRARLDSTTITLSVVDESSFLDRPAHVSWPSYNLYVFQNGAFTKVVDQGNTVGTIPAPGANPLMIVHGLGSNTKRFADAATYFANQGTFTQIYGYEYDTLDGINTTGPRLNTAYALIETNPNSQWKHLGHSMGTLISRVAFENGTNPPYQSNSVVFAAGPHLGSAAINKLQSSLSIFQQFVRYLVVNEVLDFTNADGTPCAVDITDQGFTDLAVGSAALNALNTNAAQNHPEETYRTLGGNDRGLEYDAADFVMGVYLDDGLVDLPSANTSVIGAVKSDVVPESHSSIVEDTTNSLPVILSDLMQ
ncbi:MAG: hypothetical protein KC800_04350 [Candidatus Eremiobacteraeota bacterium]|nr:hypothetical protein [Candidatus Eremiobacteraeota bacterium]